jgi:hypothetical protein
MKEGNYTGIQVEGMRKITTKYSPKQPVSPPRFKISLSRTRVYSVVAGSALCSTPIIGK